MEKLRCVLVEDEQGNRLNLKLLIEQYCPGLEVVGEAAGVQEGLRVLRQLQPDLVFLDVEMPDGTGFDLLNALPSADFRVVFVTAYSHYAIKAIKFNAVDYLLKPIDIAELCQAADKASQRGSWKDSVSILRNMISNLNSDNPLKRIPLASADALRMVDIPSILRLEGESNYTRFYIQGTAPMLVSKTIKEYESMLEEHNFVRVHQSHVVNLSAVESYVKGDGGYLIMRDGSQIPVARNRKAWLLGRLQGH